MTSLQFENPSKDGEFHTLISYHRSHTNQDFGRSFRYTLTIF
ncbi:hypothetical protein HMPREF0620_0834 [Parascardovia denticolens DSM 10105 = JCM 12538]|uniref:Uncharacterized protein n=1 Tax=Parascardovia denticolens DSM 10105 = JCM 12538 TaxID=864564 RepID=E6JYK2_PARDN|nr:hypothetical protein HMPREF0620_0834 [Parascardovia denticolens DSM 10105 = JCM 12538]